MSYSLSRRLALYIALLPAVLLGIGLVAVATLSYHNSQAIGQELTESFEQARTLDATDALLRSGRYLSKRLVNPLYDLDISHLNAEIAQIREWLPVTEFLILDAQGHIVTDGTTNNPRYGEPLEIPPGLTPAAPVTRDELEATTLFLAIGISDSEHALGYAVATLSNTAAQRSIRRLHAQGEAIWQQLSLYLVIGTLLALAAVSSAALLVSWWLSKVLSRPLREMTAAAHAFASGDLDRVLAVRSDDEVGALARSLNQMAAELKKRGNLIARSQEMANLGSWEWPHNGERLRLSDGAYRVLGLTHTGQTTTLEQVLSLIDEGERDRAADVFTGEPKGLGHCEVGIRRPDGSKRVIQISGEPTEDQTGGGFIGTLQDVTQHRENEQALSRLANYDTLTGLPNRNLMREHLHQAMHQAERHRTQLALLFLDLDRFKSINDSLGHDAGDALLKETAQRLIAVAPEANCIARLGGDELTLIVDGENAEAMAAEISERILHILSEPFDIAGRQLVISASIGITIYPRDATDMEALLRTADTAMYLAKEQGRNTYRFFTAELDRLAHARLRLEHDLRRAIADDELELHYQPQVCIRGTCLVGAEALLRWRSVEGLIGPDQFVGLLEDTGLITELTPQLFRDACHFARTCRERGLGDLRVAVNLCARELQQPGLQALIADALEGADLAPDRLEIEITEGALLDADTSLINAEAIAELGVRLALDDFGTGYSSLAYLKRYSVDCLKVDRSFVSDILDDPDDALITAAVVALAKQLDIEVVAEGVETEGQLQALRKLGCDLAQGWLFSPALPIGGFLDWAQARLATAAEG